MAPRVTSDSTFRPTPDTNEPEAPALLARPADERVEEGHPHASDLLEAFDGSAGPPSEWPGPFTTPLPRGAPEVAEAADENPDSWEAPLQLSDPQSRQMLASTLQDNELSRAAGNSDRICGGAAVVNALILSSDEKGCAANAKALKQAADALGAQKFLPPSVKQSDVEAAVKAFSQGSLRPTDVEVLQQLAYASLRAIQSDGDDKGATPAAMGVLVGQLSVNGAQLGDSKFTQVTNAQGVAHWTVSTDGFKADSLPRAPGKGPRLSWDADVSAPHTRGAPVAVRLRGGGQLPRAPEGKAYRFELPSQLMLPGGRPNLDDAARAIRQGIAGGPSKLP